jgi:UDP-N-acetylmuramate dehydrogenase
MLELQDFAKIFLEEAGLPLGEAVALSGYSSFRIGGPADYFLEVREPLLLIKAIQVARKHRCPFYVIGSGCNLLFDDSGYRGLIIKNSASGARFKPEQNYLEVDSGTCLSDLLSQTISDGLTGLEFLAGIPGTVGGAVYGNAGAFGQAIGERILEITVLGDNGKEFHLTREQLCFDYRYSALKKSHKVILKVRIKVDHASKAEVRKKIEEYLEQRSKKLPPAGLACAGSFFKNPVLPGGQKIPAGQLLERAGAKGMRVGQAAVYAGHCNFIINLGGATCSEILALAGELKEKVWKHSGIRLEEEVIFVPATASML